MASKDSKWRKLKEFLLNGFGKSSFINLEKVNTITLDKFCKKNKISKIDLLKIDTEGNEFNVLKGLKKKINIVNNILIEIHHRELFLNYNPEKIHQFLIDNGFKLVKKFKFPFCWVDSLYTKI